MLINTNKEALNINKLVCKKEETILVQGDMIVPDAKPDILSTVDTTGNVCIYRKEVLDQKIKIDGNINAYIIYTADSSEDIVRSLNISLDFSENIVVDNCKEKMLLDVDLKINKIDCEVINGRKVNVKVELKADIKIYSNEKVELINSINNNTNIQVLENNVNLNSLVGYGNVKTSVKENIKVESTEVLAEILRADINILDKDIKISYNKVLAKSEIEVKIMYLTESNKLNTVVNKFPVVGFIDIQNVSEENICDINFEIKNMIIKLNNAEDNSIYVELEIEIFCMAYENKNINLIQDLYSPIEELNCNQKNITTISEKQIKKEKCSIKEKVNIPELENGNLIDVYINEKIIKENKLNSKIIYEGELSLEFYILHLEVLKLKKVMLPFKITVENVNNVETMSITNFIEIETKDFVIQTGGDINCNIDIVLYLNMYKNLNINIIENIEVLESKNVEDYSLIMYIVKQDDTLWKIAKKFKSTVEDIVKTNNIENEDKIYPGEKLYIPKYVKQELKEKNVNVVNYE